MSGAKRFEPSKKKLEKSKNEGDVAKCPELSPLIGMLAGLVYLIYFSGLFAELLHIFTYFFGFDTPFTSNSLSILIKGAFSVIVEQVLKLFFVVFVSVVLGEILQVGCRFSFHLLLPRASRFHPWNNLAQRLGLNGGEGANGAFMGRLFITAVKLAAFFTVIAGAVCWLLAEHLEDIVRSDLNCLPTLLPELLKRTGPFVVAPLLLLALFDYLYSRFKLKHRLMMDIEELKQEFKENEGNPETLGRRKQLHREIAQHELIQAVRQAKVVITN